MSRLNRTSKGLFRRRKPHETIIVQDSVLFHDVCRTVDEPQRYYMDANPQVLSRFVLMTQTRPFYVEVETN